MQRAITAIFLLFSGLAGLSGCAPTGDPTMPTASRPPEPPVLERSWPAMAVVDWGPVDFDDPTVVADFARADLIVLETGYYWQGGANAGALDAVRAANPDVKIVGYLNAHGSWLSWGEIDRSDAAEPVYTWDWYDATREYWSHTTTGDTMQSWPGKVLLDVLDPACREAMVQVLAKHWHAHDNVFDGFFWDHFNPYLWVPLEIPGVEGEMDLDGDGIPHRQDEDEMAAYREASVDLILRVRQVLGDDVIQIANGQRAPSDSTFAALVDGMFYENFPTYNFTGEKMRSALDPAVPNNLFAASRWPRTRNGGPWLILSNAGRFTAPDATGNPVTWRLADFNRVLALLAGCVPVYHPTGMRYRYDWPEVELELGLPLGPATVAGDRVSREFEHGRVVLDYAGATSVVPFDFAVVADDTLRQRYRMDLEFD